MNQNNTTTKSVLIKKPLDSLKNAVQFEDDEIVIVNTDYTRSSVIKHNREDYESMK